MAPQLPEIAWQTIIQMEEYKANKQNKKENKETIIIGSNSSCTKDGQSSFPDPASSLLSAEDDKPKTSLITSASIIETNILHERVN